MLKATKMLIAGIILRIECIPDQKRWELVANVLSLNSPHQITGERLRRSLYEPGEDVRITVDDVHRLAFAIYDVEKLLQSRRLGVLLRHEARSNARPDGETDADIKRFTAVLFNPSPEQLAAMVDTVRRRMADTET